jgi:uncharacterized membrane protein
VAGSAIGSSRASSSPVRSYIVRWFVDTIDHWVRGLVPGNALPDAYLPFRVPWVGVVLAFLSLTFLGFRAHNLAGRSLIKLGEAILARMPSVRSIYKSVKQIFETLFSQSSTTFRKVGLIEFPNKGARSIVFISGPPGEIIGSHLSGAESYIPSPSCPAASFSRTRQRSLPRWRKIGSLKPPEGPHPVRLRLIDLRRLCG